MTGDLNIVDASQLVVVHDRGAPRRGREQRELDAVAGGALAIRDRRIVAVGPTEDVLREWGHDEAPTIDASGKSVLPGLVECHSHPLFDGERCHEYAERLGGASLADVARRGGGIWSSVAATRAASDDDLRRRLAATLTRILAGGVTTLEVKSGYGLTTESELRQLDLLAAARSTTPLQLVITFLGAHIVPNDLNGDTAAEDYVHLVLHEMLPAVVAQGIAEFHDVTVEAGLFDAEQATRLMVASRRAGLPVRVHADAWATSGGWRAAVAGGAISAEHLTFTPIAEIDEVGPTECIAVVLPVAELVYMADRRAAARHLVDTGVPVAIATDHCSSIHATSLLHSMTLAAPWFRLTPAEAIVGATLNAAYALDAAADCGSLDIGKRGDVLIVDCAHPDELFLAFGAPLVDTVVVGGIPVVGGGALAAR